MGIYRNQRFYNQPRTIPAKVEDADIPQRLDAIMANADATDRDKQFATSLKSGWDKYGSLTVGQFGALKNLENRYSDDNKKKQQEWADSFDANKRGILNACAQYYSQTPYFRDVAMKVLADPNWIPSEKQYRAMCENKYAQRMIENMASPVKYPPSTIIEVRKTSHRWEVPAGSIGMVVTADSVVGPSRGSRKYRVLMMGEAHTVEVYEKDIKIHRRKES